MTDVRQEVRQWASRRASRWVSSHPVLTVTARVLWWVVRRPSRILGITLAVSILWAGGSWWLALGGLVLPTAVRPIGRYWGIITPPYGGSEGARARAVGARRVRVLRDHWERAARAAGIREGSATDGRVPRLLDVEPTPTGVVARVACGTVGLTADRVARGADVLAAAIPDCRRVSVTEGSTPGFAHIQVQWADPLGEVVPISALPVPPKGQLSYGITENGESATIAKFKSLLIVGQSGSGKSGTLWALLASALADGVPFRLHVIDPAGGVELHALQGSPLVRAYADRPKTGADVIKKAHAGMLERLARMSGSTRMHTPTIAEPWEIVIIDELLLMTDLLKSGTSSPLGEILSIGRKAAYSVWALTQIPHVDTVGRVRNLFVQKLVLATDSRAMTDAVLGDGAESMGAACSRIPQSMPGTGYAQIEGITGYPRFRTAWVPDDMTHLIARGYLPDQVPRRSSTRTTPLGEQDHILYAWYDADGVLLYIGISNSGTRRAMEHVKDKDWAKQPGVRMEVLDSFQSRGEALEAEKNAIENLAPKHNVIHNK